MDTIGLDLHKRETQLCTLTEDGELIEQRIHFLHNLITQPAGVQIFNGRHKTRSTKCIGPTVLVLLHHLVVSR